MKSLPEFLLVAVVVTLTPGPATATVLHVTARHGRAAALATVVGNSVGVFAWGALAALGVSSLVLASDIAYAALKIVGAVVLVVIGVRSWLRRREHTELPAGTVRRRAGWRVGLVSSISNPKLAVFFVALFPQFLRPDAPVLPWSLAMAAVIVTLDVVWFSTLSYTVDRAGTLLRPRIHSTLQRITGTVLIGIGIRLAAEAR